MLIILILIFLNFKDWNYLSSLLYSTLYSSKKYLLFLCFRVELICYFQLLDLRFLCSILWFVVNRWKINLMGTSCHSYFEFNVSQVIKFRLWSYLSHRLMVLQFASNGNEINNYQFINSKKKIKKIGSFGWDTNTIILDYW